MIRSLELIGMLLSRQAGWPTFVQPHLSVTNVENVRNQGVGCALAWVTIARDSESDYPFYPVVQFRRIRAGH